MGYLPSVVRYNPTLPPEAKLLYAELTAMCGEDGRCKIDYQHLRKVFTRNTYEIKGLLNALFKATYINKDGNHITLTAIQPEPKKVFIEVDTSFIEEVVGLWNKLFAKELQHPIKKTAELTRILTERQGTFSNSEILSALTNRHDFVSRSEWHSKPDNFKHKVNIMIPLASDTKLQENLNYSQKQFVDMRRTTVAVEKEKGDQSLLN